jgi:FMN-dependent NADH-azoreductase
MKLLQIDSSALGAQSATRELTRAIVADIASRVPELEVSYRDLDREPLPHLTSSSMGGDAAQLALREMLLAEFLGADVVVIGAPMYNFGIPSTLKAWIDRIAVAGRTFRYTAEGPVGLAGGRQVIVASARGSALGDHSPADFQEAYLHQLFGFLGIDAVTFVRAEGLGLSPEHRARALREAHARISTASAEDRVGTSVAA